MTIQHLKFAPEDIGATLHELAYSQINAHARFVFDRPLVIGVTTLIEYDSKRGTFALIKSDQSRILLSGKWER